MTKTVGNLQFYLLVTMTVINIGGLYTNKIIIKENIMLGLSIMSLHYDYEIELFKELRKEFEKEPEITRWFDESTTPEEKLMQAIFKDWVDIADISALENPVLATYFKICEESRKKEKMSDKPMILIDMDKALLENNKNVIHVNSPKEAVREFKKLYNNINLAGF